MTEAKNGERYVAALDELFRPVNRCDAPGLVVGVAQHGQTTYRRGFGLASIEHATVNTPWTRLRIGSTSKQFACLAALLLAEEAKLNIDASVRSYLTELPAFKGEPTLRQLMTHTSGYRCYLDLGYIAAGKAIQPKGAALATQLRQRDMNFAPGDSMLYCNGGYHLLSLVIEKLCGMPFEQFLQQRIFMPLGMLDTASVPSDFEIHPGVATLHVPLGGEPGSWRRGIFPSEELRGEGAIVSTVDDMLRWLAHLRAPHKTVGSIASWQQMITPTQLNNGLVNPYALGLMLHDYRGLEVIHHAGGVTGGASQMLTVPSHALDIIIITNGAPAKPRELANKIIDTVLGDGVLAAAELKASSARFRPMLGARYHARASGRLLGFAETPDGQLGLSFQNGVPAPLRDEGDWLVQGFEEIACGPLAFKTEQLPSQGQAPLALDFNEAGTGERFERLPETPPTLPEVAARLLGRYRSADLDAEACVRWDGDALLLLIYGAHGTNTLSLQAFSADVFGLRELDANASQAGSGVLSVERLDDRVVGLRIGTVRTRHLHFERLVD